MCWGASAGVDERARRYAIVTAGFGGVVGQSAGLRSVGECAGHGHGAVDRGLDACGRVVGFGVDPQPASGVDGFGEAHRGCGQVRWVGSHGLGRDPAIGMPAGSQHPAGTEHAADSEKWGFATVTVRQHASQNSSTVKPARRIRERSVPCRMVDLFGTESDGAPRFLRMMWLPRRRSISQPKCSNTRTACAADTNGTGGIGI